MGLAPFFERIYASVGRHMAASRESLEEKLAKTHVVIRCGPTCVAGNDLWTAELTTNLAARLYPRLAIEGDPPVRQALESLARSINPAIQLDPFTGDSASIAIGLPGGFPAGSIAARADGWVARQSSKPLDGPRGPPNPYAAGAAACLAAGELFRRTFLGTTSENDVALSLLDFSDSAGIEASLPPVCLDGLALLGLGAVANAAIWAFSRHADLAGSGWLVDPERLELSNLQRYALGVLSDVGSTKTELAARALSPTKLHLEPRTEALEAFAEGTGGRFEIPLAVVSVDNVESRRSTQALLPRLAINGWTSESGLGASWHQFSRNAACLACLYQPHGAGKSQTDLVAQALGLAPAIATALWLGKQPVPQKEMTSIAAHLGVAIEALRPWQGKAIGDLYTDVICGAVPLDLKGTGRLETVPLAHQSALAGLLMAAETIKRATPALQAQSQKEPLVAWENVLRPPPAAWTRPRAREPGCICSDDVYQRVYGKKWPG